MTLAGIVTRNWQLKLAALAVALLLWAIMRMSDDRIGVLEIPDVPVEVEQRGQDWVLVGLPAPAAVELSVTGSVSDLFRAARADARVTIPLDTVTGPDTVIELNAAWVREVAGGTAAIEDITPSTVRLTFERHYTEEIPVIARGLGRLPDSLALEEAPRPLGSFVQVTGAEDALARLQTIYLLPVDMTTVTESGNYGAEVDETGLDDVEVRPDTVLVTINVAERESRSLGPVAVQHAELGPGLVVEPDTVVVELSGAAAVLGSVDPGAVTVRASIAAAVLARALDEAGEARVPLSASGLDDDLLDPVMGGNRLLEFEIVPDSVTVRRAEGGPEGGPDGASEGAPAAGPDSASEGGADASPKGAAP